VLETRGAKEVEEGKQARSEILHIRFYMDNGKLAQALEVSLDSKIDRYDMIHP